MAGEASLSGGALDAIFNDPDKAPKMFPVPRMQCLQVKLMAPTPQSPERYRLVISDGQNYVQSMLATQANHVIHDGKLVKGAIARIKQYTPNNIRGKNILIILDIEVDEVAGIFDKIGEPSVLESSNPETGAGGGGDTAMSGGEFYGAKKEETKTQPMQSIASRPATHAGGNIYPIEGLSPFSHKWTIKARVTVKSDIKTWHKQSGEGKLFSVNLLDESGEIKATGFNEQCDAFYDMLQEGCVYFISTPCKVQLAKKHFSTLPNDYELTFENGTVIEKAEDTSNVPQVRFNFCTIQELQNVEKDNTVDVIGVLKEVAAVDTIVSKKSGQPFEKRDLTVVDDTGMAVRITVWGKTANGFDTEPGSVIAFKGTKVSDFGGKSLSLLSSGTMSVDPDIPDAHRLKGWYDSSGRNDTFATHQNMASMSGATGRQDQVKTIVQVVDEGLGMDDNTSYYTIKASIVFTKPENFCYPACANEGCNKKVTDMGDGTWHCEKCSATHEKPDYRYILSINVADHTSHQWLTCFDEAARSIAGLSANELMDYKENDDAKFTAALESINCKKLSFRCRAKTDSYGEVPRIRHQVMSVSQLDFKSEGEKLAELIKLYNID